MYILHSSYEREDVIYYYYLCYSYNLMYACEIHVICYHILIHADYYLMILQRTASQLLYMIMAAAHKDVASW